MIGVAAPVTALATSEAPRPGWLHRVHVAWLAAPLLLVSAIGLIADLAWPALAADHPELLVAMSTRTRNLVLVAPSIDVAPFVAVALARALVGDPFAFLLGRRYGDRAVQLISRRTGRTRVARWTVQATQRAGPLAVIVAPGTVVCALTGAAGLGTPLFMACNVLGTILRIAMVRMLGDAFSDPITIAQGWIGEHRYALMGGIVVLFALSRLRARRASWAGSTPALAEVEDGLTG